MTQIRTNMVEIHPKIKALVWLLTEYFLYALHVELGCAVIIVDSVLFLFDIGELCIAIA